jgi:hypothetical protein
MVIEDETAGPLLRKKRKALDETKPQKRVGYNAEQQKWQEVAPLRIKECYGA